MQVAYQMRKSELLFLALLVVVPVQFNKFFFLEHSFVLGLPIDYRAISIYLSDLVIVSYMVIFVFENIGGLKKICKIRKNLILAFLAFNLYLIVTSSFFSISLAASLWFSLKFLEFSILAIFTSISFSRLKLPGFTSLVLIFSLFWQSVVMIWQFVFQRSLGLYFLGERAFDSSTTSIAHTQFFGSLYLRPYGTFSHPNVAAAFLVIYLTILLFGTTVSPNVRKYQFICVVVSLVALVFAYSKAAFVAAAIGLLTTVRSFMQLILIIILGGFLLGLFFRFFPPSQVASIAERLLLSQAAFDIALKNPILGIGSANFILALSHLNLFSLAEIRLLQPVHNVFLLILVENGVAGLLLFMMLLWAVLKSATTRSKIALFIILLVFLSFDHFLWTLQQGQLLLAISIGYIVGAKNVVRKSSHQKFC